MKDKKSYEHITTAEQWQSAVAFMKTTKTIAVDLESNGMHAYYEKICLMQFAAAGRAFIVDPDAMGDGSSLASILQDPKIEKIFHSCDYDVRSLERDYKIEMANLFDSSIAAQFLGSERLGLGNVITEYLGIELEKSKKLQQMNWALRPLPQKALDYAVDDVLYLEELRGVLFEKLEALGRMEWVREECQRMLKLKCTPLAPPEEAFKRMKGIKVLSAEQLPILREVYIARDKIASGLNRPAFKVMHNSTMIEMAQKPNINVLDIKGMNRGVLHQNKDLIREALDRGMASEAITFTKVRRKSPWTHLSLKIFTELKEWRKVEAEKLALAPAVIWPMVSLERIALATDAEDASAKVESEIFQNEDARNWQKKIFGNLLLTSDILQ